VGLDGEGASRVDVVRSRLMSFACCKYSIVCGVLILYIFTLFWHVRDIEIPQLQHGILYLTRFAF
jgi:hypothetical protein